MKAVGVFDSGAGGLSIVAAIRAALPAQPIVYYADTAYAPYGPRSDREILERTQVCCTRLLAEPLAALVVACNTATANAIDEVRTWAPVPVIGVEPGLKPGAARTRSGTVGVLATPATLASRRYRDLLARVREQYPAVRFVEQAGHGWVELVEAGELQSPRAAELVRAAIGPLLAQGADTLVLGCTHYPFLRECIEEAAPQAALIETGPAIARELQRRAAGALGAGDPAAACAGNPDPTAPLLRLQASGDAAQFEHIARVLLHLAAGSIARNA